MFAVRGGTSAAKPYGSHFSTTCPPRCFTAILVLRARARCPGTNNSQTPLGMCLRIGWLRRSHMLKSPTTLTLSAFGAQTAKFTPAHAVDRAQMGAEPLVAPPMRAFAEQVQVVVGQHRRERRRGRAWCGSRPICTSRGAGSGWERGIRIAESRADVRLSLIVPSTATTASYKPAGWIRRIGRVSPWAGSTTQARWASGRYARTASARRPFCFDFVGTRAPRKGSRGSRESPVRLLPMPLAFAR